MEKDDAKDEVNERATLANFAPEYGEDLLKIVMRMNFLTLRLIIWVNVRLDILNWLNRLMYQITHLFQSLIRIQLNQPQMLKYQQRRLRRPKRMNMISPHKVIWLLSLRYIMQQRTPLGDILFIPAKLRFEDLMRNMLLQNIDDMLADD